MLPSSLSFSDSGASSSSSSSPASSVNMPPFCVSPSSPVFASRPTSRPFALLLPPSRVDRLPAYTPAPPPAYSRRPALTVTVSRSTFDTLGSASSSDSLDDVLALAFGSAELDDRRRAREEDARARLMPLLFPKRKGVKTVVKGVFGRRKKPARDALPGLDDLDDSEREIAQKMYSEVRRLRTTRTVRLSACPLTGSFPSLARSMSTAVISSASERHLAADSPRPPPQECVRAITCSAPRRAHALTANSLPQTLPL